MSPPPYSSLSQLQGFIFTDEIEKAVSTPLGYRGNKGLRILVKLNEDHALRFTWPIPKDAESLVPVIGEGERNKKVCPVDLDININELHAAIVMAGFGHYLLAKPPNKF